MPAEARYSGSPHVELIKRIVESRINDINTTIPGKITQYDNQSGRAKVQPLNRLILNTINEQGINESLEIPAIDNVPVCFFGSPESRVTHNVKVGDTGLLLVCQRSADEFKTAHLTAAENPASTTPYAPKDFRKFDINDAMFFPAYFSGDKGFQGIKSKGDVAIETEGGVKIGSEGKGTMVKVAGKTMDLTDVVQDLQNQISSNQQATESIASATPFTQPSLPVVLSLNILSKIKSKISFITQRLNFSQGSFLDGLAGLAYAKATGVNATTGEVIRQQPESRTSPEELTVVMRQSVVGFVGAARDRIGWALPGSQDISMSPITHPGGDADFGLLRMYGTAWEHLVSVNFESSTRPGNTTSKVTMMFTRSGTITKIRYLVMRLFNPIVMSPSVAVNRYEIGPSSSIPEISTNHYGFSADNILIDKTYEDRFAELNNEWLALFGTDANFEYPVLYLTFEDEDGNRIQLNPMELGNG